MSQITSFSIGGITPGAVVETLTANSGGPVSPTANNINVVGSNSNNINIVGNPLTSTLTASVFGTTANAVQIGNASGSLTSVAVGTTGQVLTGVTGANPVFAAPAASSISITGDSGGALTGNAFTFTGSATGLTFAGAGTSETLGGTLVVANGGTGRATLTNHGLLIGAGTGAITQSAVGATGTVLIGNTGADPSYSATPGVTSITFGAGSALSTFNDWTAYSPTLQGSATGGTSTYTNQTGYYMKIGNLAVVIFIVGVSAATGTGSMRISLPVAIATMNAFGTILTNAVTWPALITSVGIQGNPGDSFVTVTGCGSAQAQANIQMANAAYSMNGFVAYHI